MTMDAWNVVYGVVGLLMSIAIAWLTIKSQQHDKLRDQLKAYASETVELKIAVLSGELNAAISLLKASADDIKQRLERGDENFDNTNEKWHRLELKTQQQISELRTECATKEDIRRIDSRLNEMNVTLARISQGTSN